MCQGQEDSGLSPTMSLADQESIFMSKPGQTATRSQLTKINDQFLGKVLQED